MFEVFVLEGLYGFVGFCRVQGSCFKAFRVYPGLE